MCFIAMQDCTKSYSILRKLYSSDFSGHPLMYYIKRPIASQVSTFIIPCFGPSVKDFASSLKHILWIQLCKKATLSWCGFLILFILFI